MKIWFLWGSLIKKMFWFLWITLCFPSMLCIWDLHFKTNRFKWVVFDGVTPHYLIYEILKLLWFLHIKLWVESGCYNSGIRAGRSVDQVISVFNPVVCDMCVKHGRYLFVSNCLSTEMSLIQVGEKFYFLVALGLGVGASSSVTL